MAGLNAVPDASHKDSTGAGGSPGSGFARISGSPGSSGPDAVGADVGGRGQADDQRVAAHRAGPLLAVAVQDVGTARRLRVKLLEQPLLIASRAVHTQTGPAQLRHPADPSVRCVMGPARVEGVGADSGMLSR